MGNSVPRTTLPVHGTTRYIRTHLEVEDGVLEWEVPRTLLGIVPLGSRTIEVPVAEIGFMRLRRVVPQPFQLAVGTFVATVPWLFLPWWLSLPLLLLGLWTILIATGPHLEVQTKTGGVHRAPVCFAHSLDAELYLAAVADVIRSGTDS